MEENRGKRGLFLKGHPPLSAGRPRGRCSWKTRVEQLENKYDTVEKLMSLIIKDEETGELSPSRELLRANPIDAGILMGMISQVTGRGELRMRERESYWDRMEGKPIQKTETKVEMNAADAKQLDDTQLNAIASGEITDAEQS